MSTSNFSKLMLAAAAALTLTATSTARAGTVSNAWPEIHVQGRILRPAYFKTSTGACNNDGTCNGEEDEFTCPVDCGDTQLRDRIGAELIRLVPAGKQKIKIIQPPGCGGNPFNMGGTCATLYTNSDGTFSRDVSCGPVLPCKLYVQVVGKSKRDFRVAIIDETALGVCAASSAVGLLTPAALVGVAASATGAVGCAAGVIDSAPPFLWESNSKTSGKSTDNINFGDFVMGVDGPSKKYGYRAATVMEAVDFAYQQAELKTDRWSKWVINNPLFGSPTTVESTVHMVPGLTNATALGAAAHELGHVMFNKRHYTSDWNYWTDVLGYAHNHTRCTTAISDKFAQYEGFAHAFSDIIWRNHALSVGKNRYKTPASKCPVTGFLWEGNVADFYTLAVHGEDGFQRTKLSPGDYELAKFGSDEVYLMPLEMLYDVASVATANTLADVWTKLLKERCEKDKIDGKPMYCGTERFKCRVKLGIPSTSPFVGPTGSIGDLSLADPSLNTLDCSPSATAVATLKQKFGPSETWVDITWPRADHTDLYKIKVYKHLANTKVEVDSREETTRLLNNIKLESCKKHSIVITTKNGWGETEGTTHVFWTEHPDCAPAAPVAKSISCQPAPLFGISTPRAPAPEDPCGMGLAGVVERLLCTVQFTASADAQEHQVVVYDGLSLDASHGWFKAIIKGSIGVGMVASTATIIVTKVSRCSSTGELIEPSLTVAVQARIVPQPGIEWASESNHLSLSPSGSMPTQP